MLYESLLQKGRWRWQDGSLVKYIAWASQYYFPTANAFFHNNRTHNYNRTSNSSINPTISWKSQDVDGLCGAIIIKPDYSGALLLPIDCTAKFVSHYVCTQQTWNNTSMEVNPPFVGYHKYLQNNNSVLKTSQLVCPEKYSFVHRSTCLKLVSFSALELRYMQCTKGPFIDFKDADLHLQISARCESADWRAKNKIISKFHKICTSTDKRSYFYGGFHTFTHVESQGLNNYLLQALPASSIVLHRGSGTRLLRKHLTLSLQVIECPSNFLCYLYPLQNDPNHISHVDPHFIVCARNPLNASITILPREFQSFTCSDGSFIAAALQCDGHADCPQADDEANCTYVCDLKTEGCFSQCLYPECSCNNFYYQCIDGGCMSYDKFCNGQNDCPLGEDEYGCPVVHRTKYIVSTTVQDVNYATGFCYGGTEYLPCVSQKECYSLQSLCLYDTLDGIMLHCADGTHLGGHCVFHVCKQRYKCFLSYCIPTHKVCDAVVDCPDADDEAHCNKMACPGHLRCSRTKFCVPPHEVCNGEPQCPLKEDEKFCMHCPSECSCRGNIVSCYDIDSVDHALDPDILFPNNSFSNFNSTSYISIFNYSSSLFNQNPSLLILNNSFSIFIHTLFRQPHMFEKTYCIKLNHGHFSMLLKGGFTDWRYFKLLRWLQLNNQGISVLHKGFLCGDLMTRLDLSHNVINLVEQGAFSNLTNIELLNLDSNKITHLRHHFCDSLKKLKFLFLRDNPLYDDIAPLVLSGVPNIQIIRSDWYMLCCTVIHVKDCQPRGYHISSCDSLLSFISAKVIIALEASFATLSNGVLLYLFFMAKHKNPDMPLMVSLVSADALMGVYLLLIAVMDLTTTGVFYQHVTQWTQSYICLIGGLLNFVSSEASLCILAALSIVRAVAIQKIGGLKVLKSKIICASVCVWMIVAVLTTSYLVPYYLVNLKLRNNMCIILGIAHGHNVSYFEYIFQIILVAINATCLFIICICAFNILFVAYQSQRSVQSMSGMELSRTQKLAGKLLLLLFCNLLCWIRILSIAGMLLSKGNIHEDIFAWMAIIIIPVCATTDPFLYNVHIFKCKNTKK